ncbi:hypothetical protein [Stenotrophomonas sp. TEPEL]|uniref:hypothetical protein n=1 Tax=Stenotrophomonas sp. TEPEL TaxID=2283801 RepID=UPI001F0F6E0B|nr:hypothetical protein [Stenotrophomonas sp. TEPEL]
MIGRDNIGAVTMKMINNTSITSTSGVTLMSASGPLLPALLNAMCRSLQQGRLPQPKPTPDNHPGGSVDPAIVQLSLPSSAVYTMRN